MTRRSADFEGIEAICFRLLWSGLSASDAIQTKGRIELDYPRDALVAPLSGHREVTNTVAP
jgi:hypothetical protein